jgi:hypothetical protein
MNTSENDTKTKQTNELAKERTRDLAIFCCKRIDFVRL